jgi:phage baseplate assembly protein W
MTLPADLAGGYLPQPGEIRAENEQASRYYRVVNAIWPDLLNQKSIIAPVRNGVNRETGMLMQGWDHVEQSMKVIFATGFHERILRRWVGSYVPHILGEIAVPRIITRFHWAMAESIELWEPNYRIQTVFFMDTAIEQWQPTETFDVAGEFRLGHVFFRTEGNYRPRAHLGDPSPYIRRANTLLSRGGEIWDPALGGQVS